MQELQVQAPQLPEPKVFFIASLSNGETVVEGRGVWYWANEIPSPWNRLIRYTVEKKLTINSLSLSTPHGAVFTIPTAGGRPRFRGFADDKALKPLDYEVKRYLARDMDIGIVDKKAEIEGVEIAEFYTIAEAIYKDYSVEVWVNELNPRLSWTVVKTR
jgi:hypothetical protein